MHFLKWIVGVIREHPALSADPYFDGRRKVKVVPRLLSIAADLVLHLPKSSAAS
jgi:hypothetical protein